MERVGKLPDFGYLGLWEQIHLAAQLMTAPLGMAAPTRIIGGATFETVPYLMARVAYSPHATRIFLDGLAQLPRGGTATASIARAFEVASQYQTGKKHYVKVGSLPPVPNLSRQTIQPVEELKGENQ
jgi:hypothetical protein